MLTMKVEGLKELQAQLMELGALAASKALAKAARKAFKPVLDSAKGLVPVDVGTLRDSLSIKVIKPKVGESVIIVGLHVKKGKSKDKNAAWRWHFIELGTSHSAAKPFARPALDMNAQPMVNMLKTEIAKELSRIAKKKARALKVSS